VARNVKPTDPRREAPADTSSPRDDSQSPQAVGVTQLLAQIEDREILLGRRTNIAGEIDSFLEHPKSLELQRHVRSSSVDIKCVGHGEAGN